MSELKRWYVYTNKGRKVTWACSSEAAEVKAEKWGLEVSHVLPAPSLLEQMATEPLPTTGLVTRAPRKSKP